LTNWLTTTSALVACALLGACTIADGVPMPRPLELRPEYCLETTEEAFYGSSDDPTVACEGAQEQGTPTICDDLDLDRVLGGREVALAASTRVRAGVRWNDQGGNVAAQLVSDVGCSQPRALDMPGDWLGMAVAGGADRTFDAVWASNDHLVVGRVDARTLHVVQRVDLDYPDPFFGYFVGVARVGDWTAAQYADGAGEQSRMHLVVWEPGQAPREIKSSRYLLHITSVNGVLYIVWSDTLDRSAHLGRWRPGGAAVAELPRLPMAFVDPHVASDGEALYVMAGSEEHQIWMTKLDLDGVTIIDARTVLPVGVGYAVPDVAVTERSVLVSYVAEENTYPRYCTGDISLSRLDKDLQVIEAGPIKAGGEAYGVDRFFGTLDEPRLSVNAVIIDMSQFDPIEACTASETVSFDDDGNIASKVIWSFTDIQPAW
jgi:hypothetical protein